MNDRRLHRLLDDVLEVLHRAEVVLDARLADMADASPAWPAGRGFEGVGGRASVSFCEMHERERCGCGGGTTYPALADPTGESAVLPNRAQNDRNRLESALKRIGNDAGLVVSILASYSPRQATAQERLETLRASERSLAALECWSCARGRNSSGAPIFSPAARRVTLPDGECRPLCEWCRAWLRDASVLPSVRQVQDHDRGIRVRRPVAS